MTTGPIELDVGTRAWLHGEALPGERVRCAERLLGGCNNELILLLTEADGRYVLRRFRPGGESGVRRNTCEVEAALLRRLHGRLPLPELVAADPDGAATGCPSLLYRYIRGVPLTEALADASGPAAADLGRAVGAALALVSGWELPRPGRFEEASLVPQPPDGRSDLQAFVEHCLAVAERRPPPAGGAAPRLGASDARTLRRLAERAAPLCARAAADHRLVHNDFNPKNLLVGPGRDGRWEVAAVLDWELAFSGPPLMDVGNMLRFEDDYPPDYSRAFLDGFRDGGGPLPDDWRRTSRALDLFALADILTDPPDRRVFDRVRAVMLRRAAAENVLSRSVPR
ncbi:phosphotransferase family protein [Kitasatospora sp. NPDC059795]|uniref:phosphotransferase family protein n=1 Tax=Kitasatospora sp. NPDC059795 TaxID=3346949 RepID=UPI00366A3187